MIDTNVPARTIRWIAAYTVIYLISYARGWRQPSGTDAVAKEHADQMFKTIEARLKTP